ncbi:MAG: toxin-antitoxin system HicB family antitoxin, partial [Moorea sp. SIO3I7]|nr:toxin-antitoxin system HicB family antitoxin [Moorena sp. SIO3I7]
MKVNHQHYTYSITWLKEDEEFVGLCAEFPSLSHLDTSGVAALEGISTLVAEVLEDMEA